MILGLSVDGGGQIRASQRANDIAAEAARAGGQQINVSDAIAGNPTVLNQTNALAAVKAYLDQAAAAAGLTLAGYTVTFPDTVHIAVTVKLQYHTAILGFMGINDLPASGSGTAALVLAFETENDMSDQLLASTRGSRIRRSIAALVALS